MGKLEELMQNIMKVIQKQGFDPDAVELKVKVDENWYSVKWKRPTVYGPKTDFLGSGKREDKTVSGASKKVKTGKR